MSKSTQRNKKRKKRIDPRGPYSDAALTTTKVGIGLVTVAMPLVYFSSLDRGFVFPKLILLNLGCLLLVLGMKTLDKRVAIPAAIWFASSVAASLFGVDALMSITGNRGQASGLLLMLPCALLVAVGPSLPADARSFAMRCLAWTGVAVAVITIFQRLEWLDELPIFGSIGTGSTVGHSALLLGFLAVGLGAGLALPWPAGSKPWGRLVPLALIAGGIGAASQRLSLAIPVVVLAVFLLKVPEERRRTLIGAGVVAASLALMFFLPGLIEDTPAASSSGGGPKIVEEFAGATDAGGRVTAAKVYVRASMDRPVFGWGPGNSSGAFVSTATVAEQLTNATRSDAHNIFIQILLQSGVVGLVAFLWLVFVVVRGLWSAPPQIGGWTSAAAAGVLAYSVLEPLTVVATPLMFFVAGLGCARAPAKKKEQPEGRVVLSTYWRAAVAVVVSASLVMAMLMVASEVALNDARETGSIASLRRAVSLWPWSWMATENLAVALARQGAEGDTEAASEALRMAEQLIELHPYEQTTYVTSGAVAQILGDDALAASYLAKYKEQFPGETRYLNSVTGADSPSPPASPSPTDSSP